MDIYASTCSPRILLLKITRFRPFIAWAVGGQDWSSVCHMLQKFNDLHYQTASPVSPLRILMRKPLPLQSSLQISLSQYWLCRKIAKRNLYAVAFFMFGLTFLNLQVILILFFIMFQFYDVEGLLRTEP